MYQKAKEMKIKIKTDINDDEGQKKKINKRR